MLVLLASTAEAQTNEARRIVVLSEIGLSSPAVSSLVRDLYSTLQLRSPYPIEFYSEYLETELFPDDASQADIRSLFIRKYQKRRPDVIIAAGPTPIKFLAAVHEQSSLESRLFFVAAVRTRQIPHGLTPISLEHGSILTLTRHWRRRYGYDLGQSMSL
jgi:hypothetical protein